MWTDTTDDDLPASFTGMSWRSETMQDAARRRTDHVSTIKDVLRMVELGVAG